MKFHQTKHAPAAIGPYSQAVAVDGWLYTSGQVGLDPKTGKMVSGENPEETFKAQAHQVIENLQAVLKNAGCHFSDVVKATIYVTDLANFAILNEIYGDAMGAHRPARSTVQVAGLPAGALVEIDLVARIS